MKEDQAKMENAVNIGTAIMLLGCGGVLIPQLLGRDFF